MFVLRVAHQVVRVVKVYVLLRADDTVYGADYIVGVFSTLEAAQAASGERDDEWKPGTCAGTWDAGLHGVSEIEVDEIG